MNVALPEDDREIYKVWCELKRNNSKTAERYGVGESAVRKRMRPYQAARPYNKLPLAGNELHGAWLKAGADCHSTTRLAATYGVSRQAVYKALRLHFDRTDPI
jgi:hypothetical protein